MFKKVINVLLFLLLHMSFSEAYSQERFIIVKDSITREMLPYSSIDFQNGYGLFTDEAGKVVLNSDLPNKIKITHIGYSSKTIAVDKLTTNEILLQPETNVMSEMKISASRKGVKKHKELNVKPSLHDNIDEMYWSSIGQQFAFFIPYEKENGVLKSVTIPLIVKDLYQGITESSFEDNPYGTMMRFEFMGNSGLQPGSKLYEYEKIFVIHSDKEVQKAEVNFEEPIAIPENGFFVVMTVIGKTDKKGEYVPELPFVVNDTRGEKKKSMKIILPNYPLVELSKGQLMLIRNVFSDNPKWSRIERPMVYKKDKKYPPFTIGIGYTISY